MNTLRRPRCANLDDDEFRKFKDLGGSKWLRSLIPEAWAKLPAAVREQSDKRASDPFWRRK